VVACKDERRQGGLARQQLLNSAKELKPHARLAVWLLRTVPRRSTLQKPGEILEQRLQWYRRVRTQCTSLISGVMALIVGESFEVGGQTNALAAPATVTLSGPPADST
jgi:hypothetical protein